MKYSFETVAELIEVLKKCKPGARVVAYSQIDEGGDEATTVFTPEQPNTRRAYRNGGRNESGEELNDAALYFKGGDVFDYVGNDDYVVIG